MLSLWWLKEAFMHILDGCPANDETSAACLKSNDEYSVSEFEKTSISIILTHSR